MSWFLFSGKSQNVRSSTRKTGHYRIHHTTVKNSWLFTVITSKKSDDIFFKFTSVLLNLCSFLRMFASVLDVFHTT